MKPRIGRSSMRRRLRPVPALAVLALHLAGGSAAADPPDPELLASGGTGVWRVIIDNDLFFNSDNQFSSGVAVQRHGRPRRSWKEVGGTPAFGKRFAALFLPTDREEFLFREAWAIGQNLQTPDDLSRADPIPDDFPYAALLGYVSAWNAYNESEERAFAWLFGVVGEPALGEDVQRPLHRFINSPVPEGWDNQLADEIVVNLYFDRRWKLRAGEDLDLAAAYGIKAGTLLTAVDARLEFRFGRNLPGGFLYLPDPTGRGTITDSYRPPRRAVRSSRYGSVALRVAGINRSLFLDGNNFRRGPEVKRVPVVGEIIFGLHYQRRGWGIHLNWWISTPTVDPDSVNPDTDTSNAIGSLMFELRR